MTEEQAKPEIRLVALDKTEYVNEEIVKKTGKVFLTYLVDTSVHTFLCCPTPSLWLECFGFFTEKEIDDDTYDLLLQESYESSEYYTVRSVGDSNSLDVTKYHIDDFPGYEDGEDYDEWFNDIIEYYQGNTMECELADLVGLEFI